MDIALKECKFGKFHYRLLGATFLGTTANILVSVITAYLLPNAECDLNMNLVQKGVLNAIPFIGKLNYYIIIILLYSKDQIYYLQENILKERP